MNDRDSTLFYNIYREPNAKYIKKVVMKQVDEDIEDFKYYRRQIWKKSPKTRISDMSKMRFKDLYSEAKYVKPDIGPKGIYTKEELIEILSERYDSGISLEEIYNSPLYKQMTKAGISISGLSD